MVSPPALATRSTSWVSSGSRRTASSSRSRSDSGSSQLSSPSQPSSVSTNSGLPSVRRYSASARSAASWRPRIPAASSAVSWLVSRGSSTRSTQAIRSSAASIGRSGWVRCSSSERNVTMISSPLMARWLPIRKVSRSRLDRSAQCASSMTSTTGECRARWSSALSTSSNSRARASPGSLRLVSGSPSSGSSRASPRVVRPGNIEATASAPSSWTRSRSTAVNGAKGSPSVPSSRQPPVSTRAPAAVAAWPNSLTSRDLPTPASPPSSTAVGPPWRTLSNAASRAAICSSRPTRTGLAARPLISAVSMSCGPDIPGAGAGAVTTRLRQRAGAAGTAASDRNEPST